MSDCPIVEVQSVSKKFCKSLKRSLNYGLRDLAGDILGSSGRGATLRKDEFWAVNDVSFELRRGECIGLIGHNGAGKTTLLKMLSGLFKPDAGRITLRGKVGALIALGAGFSPILTGRENIYVNGSILGLSRAQIDAQIDEIIDFAEIREFIDAPVQGYSSGMAVRLGFAIAAKCKPDILLLDEVLAVGDIAFQSKCYNTLSEYRRNGTAFILVSHNLHHIIRYCDRVLFMEHGRMSYLGPVDVGVQRFLTSMNSSSSSGVPHHQTTDWGRVYGSGEIVLKGATFYDETGAAIEQMTPGEPFSIALDIECPGAQVADPVVDMVIRDNEGVLFQGTNENFGHEFGVLPHECRIRIDVANLPSNAQELFFSFALMSRRDGHIYDWKRMIRLRTKSNPYLTGRLAPEIVWRVEEVAHVS